MPVFFLRNCLFWWDEALIMGSGLSGWFAASFILITGALQCRKCGFPAKLFSPMARLIAGMDTWHSLCFQSFCYLLQSRQGGRVHQISSRTGSLSYEIKRNSGKCWKRDWYYSTSKIFPVYFISNRAQQIVVFIQTACNPRPRHRDRRCRDGTICTTRLFHSKVFACWLASLIANYVSIHCWCSFVKLWWLQGVILM